VQVEQNPVVLTLSATRICLLGHHKYAPENTKKSAAKDDHLAVSSPG
jgi:hypothetical protein